MVQIQFAIEGELQLSRKLRGIAANARDWGPAFKQSADDLVQVFSGPVFETEGQEIDEKWSPLSKAYALRKTKKFPGTKILEATGNMRASFMSKYDSMSATIWNATEYFKYHQSKEPREKLPRRVMMKLTDSLREMVVKNFHQYFYDTINK